MCSGNEVPGQVADNRLNRLDIMGKMAFYTDGLVAVPCGKLYSFHTLFMAQLHIFSTKYVCPK